MTRATIISRSNSPNTASIPNMARPAGGRRVERLGMNVKSDARLADGLQDLDEYAASATKRSEDQTASMSNSRRTAPFSTASKAGRLLRPFVSLMPLSS